KRGAAMTTANPSTSLVNPSRRRLVGVLGALAALAALGILQDRGRSASPAATPPQVLRSRARPAQPKAAPLAVGAEVRTTAGQRRRLLLPGGALLYVNENSRVKLDAAGKATLAEGEVYVEAAPAKAEGEGFVVLAAGRPVTGRGDFGVVTGESGTRVLVT